MPTHNRFDERGVGAASSLDVGSGPRLDSGPVTEATSGGELPDGYYRVDQPANTDISQINPASWLSSPNLHDGDSGDTLTGYAGSNTGFSFARQAVLAAKAAGMTIDEVYWTPGYANSVTIGAIYGAQNIAGPWFIITFGAINAPLDHGGVFTYGLQQTVTNGGGGPYRYIGYVVQDSGGLNNQAGNSDMRLTFASVDVGPV